MPGVPRSEQFDDVYFSVSDGLAETRHVFLAGNNLPEAWEGRADFTVCETGFGTGLNFLAVWKLWKAATPSGARLTFISVEKYPLAATSIAEALAHWQEDIGTELDALVEKYPEEKDGVFRIEIAEDVTLILVFGDVNDVLPTLETPVDCWFLDGFRPASNPDMWSETVFANMARLSRDGASFATFTAAGFVRRGLAAAGFDVRKVPGYGRKREMCVGKLRP